MRHCARQVSRNNSLVLSGVALASVGDLTQVDAVLQVLVEGSPVLRPQSLLRCAERLSDSNTHRFPQELSAKFRSWSAKKSTLKYAQGCRRESATISLASTRPRRLARIYPSRIAPAIPIILQSSCPVSRSVLFT